jgi:hypothetical protein
MFRFSLHSALLLALTVACSASYSLAQEKAADPTGTWTWERSFNDRGMSHLLLKVLRPHR